MCHFRDNILLASTYPDSPEERLVHRVCAILQECRGLRVVCDCDQSCTYTCLRPEIQAMGYGLYRGSNGQGMAHLQPSSLTPQWALKLDPSLCTPETQPTGYLKSLFSSVLASGNLWCATWAGQLLSAIAWCQVALLCAYDKKHVAHSMHNAIQRAYGDSIHDSTKTAAYVHQTVALLPLPRCCHLQRICSHIQGIASRRGAAYSTWEIQEAVFPDGITGAWCRDINILQCVCVCDRTGTSWANFLPSLLPP